SARPSDELRLLRGNAGCQFYSAAWTGLCDYGRKRLRQKYFAKVFDRFETGRQRRHLLPRKELLSSQRRRKGGSPKVIRCFVARWRFMEHAHPGRECGFTIGGVYQAIRSRNPRT